MTADLLSCPFCGGSAERIDFGPGSGDNEGGSCIACTKCQSSGPVEFGYKENFVSNWNRRALSHAAGQDGEQCRAASGEPDAWLYEYEHDGESDHCLSRVRFLPSWVEAKRATEHPLYLRALSRGVPEGMVLVPRVPTEAMCDAPGERGWAWKNEDEFSADDAESVYRAMIEAAIAAQRKEGDDG